MESNHRSSLCKSAALAAMPRDHLSFRRAEAARLELASGAVPPPVFETGSSSSRLTSSVAFRSAKGRSFAERKTTMICGGRNRTCDGAVNSRPTVPARKHHKSRRGWVRTSIFVLPKHVDFPFLPHAVRAPSGSRTRTSAMARQQAAATSWALSFTTGLSNNKWDPRGSNPHLPG